VFIRGSRLCLALVAALALSTTAPADQATYTNPTLAGDYPDPSVVRAGTDYWATATTSEWAPIFPVLHSRDLVNWRQVGAVFDTPPAWSSGSYWAPEIASDGRRFFVYYTARKKDGPLCVAVATALRAIGPYTDHGPLVCQDAGSIDGAPVTDENGQRYLVWKEDGNSRKQPTPIWAQRLTASGTALVGEPQELIRNSADWEAHLIEGPFLLRREGWFYMFYSADACCGRACDYKLGVARARRLLGPWERSPSNPILAGNTHWKCPGHGSVVAAPNGREYLLYHAYRPDDFQFAGRQGMLDAVTWTADGWPAINDGQGPSANAAAPLGIAQRPPQTEFVDELGGPRLGAGWQWPWNRTPGRRFVSGSLALRAAGHDLHSAVDTIVARQTRAGNYTVTTRVRRSPRAGGAMAGLAAYGDAANALGISVEADRIVLWRREKGDQQIVATSPGTASVHADLRMTASDARRFRFAFSLDGREWQAIGDEADGGYLPPWDRAVRVALAVGGPAGAEGRFDWLRLETRK
jgi:xylan 1,4-beta-xylosidase